LGGGEEIQLPKLMLSSGTFSGGSAVSALLVTAFCIKSGTLIYKVSSLSGSSAIDKVFPL